MKPTVTTLVVLLLISCGAPQSSSTQGPIIQDEPTTVVNVDPIPVEEIEVVPSIPESAITANYRNGTPAFYGYVESVGSRSGEIVIAFEDDLAPKIVLNDAEDATLSYLRFPEFESDLLLIDTRLKDLDIQQYYLFILKNNQWKEVVNGWGIHNSNKPEALTPISMDPDKSNHMLRYYSVFNLDKESSKKYSWMLLEESVPIANR